jgi:MOSC domain-containing protein YiiM
VKELNENTPMAELMRHFRQKGTVTWIGVRPARNEAVLPVKNVKTTPGNGLEGDRFKGSANSPRQVTLIQAEHLAAVASMMNKESVDPGLLRRNIVVQGINLLALKDKTFAIGTAVLEMTGLCHPCSKMEKALGFGGYNAMRGHGGITAKVIQEGLIQVGDSVLASEADSGG